MLSSVFINLERSLIVQLIFNACVTGRFFLDRQTCAEYFSEYYMKMRRLLQSSSMIMVILRRVTASSLQGIKLYRSIVEFVIGCMFMTKAAHGGTLM